MKLKSFGCSFVYGNELSDCHDQPSELTWPALVAKHLGLDYNCHAAPGVGNLYILHQILKEIDREPAIYFVNWSWIDRFDYLDSYDNRWQTLLPNETGAAAQTYYRDLHSQYRDKLTNLIYIQTAVDALSNQNQKFVMTAMDNLLFETEWHCDTVVQRCQDYIAPHIKSFEGYSFLDWSRQHNYPESELWHPLEDAHRAAADYVLRTFIPALSK